MSSSPECDPRPPDKAPPSPPGRINLRARSARFPASPDMRRRLRHPPMAQGLPPRMSITRPRVPPSSTPPATNAPNCVPGRLRSSLLASAWISSPIFGETSRRLAFTQPAPKQPPDRLPVSLPGTRGQVNRKSHSAHRTKQPCFKRITSAFGSAFDITSGRERARTSPRTIGSMRADIPRRPMHHR